MMKHLPILIPMLLLHAYVNYAQSVGPAAINSAGHSRNIAGKTYEYAIGGFMSGSSFISGSLVVTPGVLQPFLKEETGTNDPSIQDLALSVYPNPANRALFIQPAFSQPGTLNILLYDILGRELFKGAYELKNGNELQTISMEPFIHGQYNLVIQWNTKNNTLSRTYKIQKIN